MEQLQEQQAMRMQILQAQNSTRDQMNQSQQDFLMPQSGWADFWRLKTP
jgi:hypothetical protein